MSSIDHHHLVGSGRGRAEQPIFWTLTLSALLAFVAVIGAWALWGGHLTLVHGAQQVSTDEAARFSSPPGGRTA